MYAVCKHYIIGKDRKQYKSFGICFTVPSTPSSLYHSQISQGKVLVTAVVSVIVLQQVLKKLTVTFFYDPKLVILYQFIHSTNFYYVPSTLLGAKYIEMKNK